MIASVRGEVLIRRPDHAADALAVAICHANGAPIAGALAAVGAA